MLFHRTYCHILRKHVLHKLNWITAVIHSPQKNDCKTQSECVFTISSLLNDLVKWTETFVCWFLYILGKDGYMKMTFHLTKPVSYIVCSLELPSWRSPLLVLDPQLPHPRSPSPGTVDGAATNWSSHQHPQLPQRCRPRAPGPRPSSPRFYHPLWALSWAVEGEWHVMSYVRRGARWH